MNNVVPAGPVRDPLDIADGMTALVAIEVIEATQAGERNPVKLHEAVMLWAARAA